VGALKDALTAYRDLPPVTRSELERSFLALCRDAGLPSPAVHVWIAGQEVDALWPDQRLVVELDGRTYHQTRAAFERDRLSDETVQLAGYRVLRVTRRRLDTDAAAVIGSIRSVLS
jgi:very-short-patch-repair endonuclease